MKFLFFSIESLIEEARKLDLYESAVVKELIEKIRVVYLDERVKYLTIYTGQVSDVYLRYVICNESVVSSFYCDIDTLFMLHCC